MTAISLPDRAGRYVLGVPLELKLLGANVIILAAAALAISALPGFGQMEWLDITIVAGALAAAFSVNIALVHLALKPVTDLEIVAKRVSQGRLGERVPPSVVADSGLSQLGKTINEMLDTVAASRERMRKIGAEVVFAQEKERGRLARDLHDSIGQTIVAASFQLAAALNELPADAQNASLTDARDLLRTAVEEIRNLSLSLHPRVADDLGLPMALEALADATRERSLVDVRATSDVSGVTIPAPMATTLYRVAQEALRNVEKHADAAVAIVTLRARPGVAELEVRDDGQGFDSSSENSPPDSALHRLQERLSLAGGELHIDSTRESGTRVFARVNL